MPLPAKNLIAATPNTSTLADELNAHIFYRDAGMRINPAIALRGRLVPGEPLYVPCDDVPVHAPVRSPRYTAGRTERSVR